MHYISFCRNCNAITGFDAGLVRMACKKCGTVYRTPTLKLMALSGLLAGLTFLSCWIIYFSIMALL